MKVALALLLAVLLAAGAAFAAVSLVPACGVSTTFLQRWLNFCTPDEVLGLREQAALIEERNDELRRDVARMERELSAIQCTAVYNTPVQPDILATPEPTPAPFPTPDPAPTDTQPDIDSDAWRRGDLAVLDGCWDLDSDYKVEHVRTGETTHFNQWRMCFSAGGQGSEEMRATNGVTCNGPVLGQFDGNGRLDITEPDNLPCSNQTYIYRRALSCTLNADGRATCAVRQPEINRTSQVQLRRSPGGQ